MINNKTEYSKLKKNSLLEHLINLVYILPMEQKQEFFADLDEESEKIEISEIDTEKNLKESNIHLCLLIDKIKLIESEVLKTQDKNFIVESGFFELFSSPHLRYNGELIKELYTLFKYAFQNEENLVVGQFLKDSKNVKIQGHLQGILQNLLKKREKYIKIFNQKEFLFIITIYFLYSRLKKEIKSEYECLELDESHILTFDRKFIDCVIKIFTILWKENLIEVSHEKIKELLDKFCLDCYQKLNIRIHPYPWTCF